MQNRLRTLLIVLALGPPVLAWLWFIRPMLSPKQAVELLQLSTMGCIAGVPIWLPIVFAGYAVGRQDCSGRLLLTFAIAELLSVGFVTSVIRFLSAGFY